MSRGDRWRQLRSRRGVRKVLLSIGLDLPSLSSYTSSVAARAHICVHRPPLYPPHRCVQKGISHRTLPADVYGDGVDVLDLLQTYFGVIGED